MNSRDGKWCFLAFLYTKHRIEKLGCRSKLLLSSWTHISRRTNERWNESQKTDESPTKQMAFSSIEAKEGWVPLNVVMISSKMSAGVLDWELQDMMFCKSLRSLTEKFSAARSKSKNSSSESEFEAREGGIAVIAEVDGTGDPIMDCCLGTGWETTSKAIFSARLM